MLVQGRDGNPKVDLQQQNLMAEKGTGGWPALRLPKSDG
jgi:hypothetical protein